MAMAILSGCWSWIPLLWRPDNDSFEHLPDDILINILSGLPAICVGRSRKRWQRLMSTTSFAELHAEKAKLAILLKHEDDCIYIKDELKNKKRYRRRKQVAAWGLPRCSCNGLLLFLQAPWLHIWNPITGEYVSLPVPQPQMFVSAFFFHPVEKEYTVLSYVTDHKVAWFEMLSLRTRSWRRLSGIDVKFPHLYPHSFAPPPVVCGAMHWVSDTVYGASHLFYGLKCIMRLNLQSEELDTLPHPDERRFSWEDSFVLMEMEERLSLCSCSCSGGSFDVWMLMDYEKWDWVKRYRVSIKSMLQFDGICRLGNIRTVDGDLLVYWHGNGLYSCDVRASELRRIVVEGIDSKHDIFFEHDLGGPWLTLGVNSSMFEPHVNTIVSLRNLYGYKGEFDFLPMGTPLHPTELCLEIEVAFNGLRRFLLAPKKCEETITVISF